ncbi:simple sugar transport system permease protein [Alkalibacterium subtropicum]|uniref:Simple sugar transport system permease protein n=1 Tax=Alkalibacterium subtropicum TaxID=753702 RepID=A0A1I1GU70_9LACT|nr:ABC transporter permease [Alkalibacterium subtropicum]SFC13388.1 simple sugar transport system permease protein [Alkalibacterium subtropicum]
MNIVSLLQLIVSSSLIYAAPLIFTAIGGAFSERGGIVNIGLEGIMVMGAFASAIFNLTFTSTFGDMTPWLGLLAGALIGILFSLIHAVATVHLRADHIISGTVINLAAPALAVFLTRAIYGAAQTGPLAEPFGRANIFLLHRIPVIGPIFFENTSGPAYLGILVAVISWVVMFKTRFGLRLRSVGEHPHAAETLGINVYFMKYAGVLISGLLGGIGGAIQAQAISNEFGVLTIAGQGFISLAAMIFGKWNPLGAMGAAIFFGFAQSLARIGNYIPIIQDIPGIWLQIMPYLLTIIVLVGVVGKAVAPKAIGKTFIKSK